MNTIFYRDIQKLIDAADHKGGGKIDSLVYLKCSRTRRTGGEWVKLENVQKCGLPYNCKDNEMLGFVDASGKVSPVYLRLIYEINGMTVTP